MKCKECGYEISEDVMFCGKCGKPTSGSNKIKCEECGYEMDSNLEYCSKCGKRTLSPGDNSRKRNRRDSEDDDDDEGGIFGGISNLIGKLFGK